MNDIVDQLFKIEQTAQDMQSSIDEKKSDLRTIYERKQQEFDSKMNQQTQKQLKEIQFEINQKEEANKKELYSLYENEIKRLEKEYRQKKDDIVQEIVGNILKA